MAWEGVPCGAGVTDLGLAPPPSNGPVAVLASNDVWVQSLSGCSPSGSGFSCTIQLNHWDGATWTAYTLPV